MIQVATIITHNHIDQALTLHESMCKWSDVTLHILITNPHRERLNALRKVIGDNIQIHLTEELTEGQDDLGISGRFIVSKYSFLSLEETPDHINPNDYLRWSLKPIFLRKLLQSGIENIFYCDCDLFFYQDYSFLLEYFQNHRILLSPHWRSIRPIIDNDYKFNFIHGLYNAGFVGLRNDTEDMLQWWGEMCALECNADASMHGTYVDQKYLDLVPLYFSGTYIIRHKGCNVAGWNRSYLERQVKNGIIHIAGDPLIFIHFSPVTIENIENGMDYRLYDVYQQYQEVLKAQRLTLLRKQMPECISQRKADDEKKAVI